MIILRPVNLHWLNGVTDDRTDLCAHAGVEFQVNGDWLIRPSDGIWTVSAAALYLLRALSQPHTKLAPIGKHLFPCCGFGMFEVEGQDDVLILGCNSGMDFELVRDADEVVLTDASARQYRVAAAEWLTAVCDFSDAVRAFYAASSPKQPADEIDAKAYQIFLAEWSRRRSLAERERSAVTPRSA
jgi:hypothetical protein